MLAVSGLAPAVVAAMLVANESPAAHDGGVARVLALRAEPWRATDIVLDSLFSLVPLGTQAARAALAGGLVAGIASAVLYRLGCALLAPRDGKGALPFVVACIGALASTLARPWQTEAASVGGSVSGALLILAPIAVVARADADGSQPPISWPAAAFGLALALGHEPCVGTCALAGCSAMIGASAPARRSLAAALRAQPTSLAAAGVAGLALWLVALTRVRLAGAAVPALSNGWSGETGASVGGSPAQYVQNDVGSTLVVLAIVGLAIAARSPRSRPLAAGLAVVAVLGPGFAWLGAPVGPTRFGAPLLAGFGATGVLASATMEAIAAAVAAMKVPLSRWSAGMVVLLELVLPVEAADDSLLTSRAARAGYAAAVWNDVAWGTMPLDTVALVTSPIILDRAIAARAQGEVRGDIVVAPLCPRCAPPWHAFARDPALVAVWRDVALTGAPTEASLSAAAAERTILLAYEPSWGPAAARHLVPFSLFDRFAPEPRGPSDRRRALDGFAPQRDRLAALTSFDPELSNASVSLLRPRAMRMAKDGDRALAERAASDAAAFER